MMQQITTHLIALCVGGLLGVMLMAMIAVAKEYDHPFLERH